MTLPLVAGGVVPWTKDDRPSMVSIVAPKPHADRLTIVPLADARVVGDAGEEPWPDDLTTRLAGQSGIAVDEGSAPSQAIAGTRRETVGSPWSQAPGRPATS